MHDLLTIENLEVELHTRKGKLRALDRISLSVANGRTLALVGESGCGKSLTALSILRLLPDPPAKVVGGRILFRGRDLVEATEREMMAIRGCEISMIFQEPMTSLNPVVTVGSQLIEVLRAHTEATKSEAARRAVELLELVGIPNAAARMDEYPHRLSGGMNQRVMIAMAIACGPTLLIADEPTTALDVTIQAQILELLRKIQRDRGMGLVIITHDLGVVAEMADEVVVMYAGSIVERAPVENLFEAPLHPYTRGLMGATPSTALGRRKRLEEIRGMVPLLSDLPDGCAFAARCGQAMDVCLTKRPQLSQVSGNHSIACFAFAPSS